MNEGPKLKKSPTPDIFGHKNSNEFFPTIPEQQENYQWGPGKPCCPFKNTMLTHLPIAKIYLEKRKKHHPARLSRGIHHHVSASFPFSLETGSPEDAGTYLLCIPIPELRVQMK
jgi:hypothetical protein